MKSTLLKFVIMLSVAALCFGFASCGKVEEKKPSKEESKVVSEENDSIYTENGIKFIGELKDGQPISGTVSYPDGNKGNLDKANNTISFDNGDVYTGDIDYLCRHGEGVMVYANGDRYEGEWKDDVINGVGTMYFANGDVYTGSFKDGVTHGTGKLVIKATDTKEGVTYEGEYENGLCHGQGTCIWDNGTIYTGGYVNGAREGYGELEMSDGESYKGYWVKDKREGADGELHYANGDRYVGPFINDLPDTRQKNEDGSFVILEDGNCAHGVKGMYFCADGRTYTGYFEEGKIVTAKGELIEDTTPDYINPTE